MTKRKNSISNMGIQVGMKIHVTSLLENFQSSLAI